MCGRVSVNAGIFSLCSKELTSQELGLASVAEALSEGDLYSCGTVTEFHGVHNFRLLTLIYGARRVN